MLRIAETADEALQTARAFSQMGAVAVSPGREEAPQYVHPMQQNRVN